MLCKHPYDVIVGPCYGCDPFHHLIVHALEAILRKMDLPLTWPHADEGLLLDHFKGVMPEGLPH